MSWDIFVQDFPKDAKTIIEIPDEFQPTSIGSRSKIIKIIKEIIPSANFSDPSWGIIDGEDWSIEVNMGTEEECEGFTFHVSGSDEAAGVITAILEHLSLRAIDSQTGEFFVAGNEVMASLKKWRNYRDQVLSDKG